MRKWDSYNILKIPGDKKPPKKWNTFDGRKDKRGKTNCDEVACSSKTGLSTMKNPSSNYV